MPVHKDKRERGAASIARPLTNGDLSKAGQRLGLSLHKHSLRTCNFFSFIFTAKRDWQKATKLIRETGRGGKKARRMPLDTKKGGESIYMTFEMPV